MQSIFRATAGWCFSPFFGFLSFPEKTAAGADRAVSPMDDSEWWPSLTGLFLKSCERCRIWAPLSSVLPCPKVDRPDLTG